MSFYTSMWRVTIQGRLQLYGLAASGAFTVRK